jgi:adenine-specific DNA-methyltransferase
MSLALRVPFGLILPRLNLFTRIQRGCPDVAGDTPALRKARGAFFTPPELAQYLSDWAIRTPDDVVLEPSCGDAEFLLAAGRRVRQLGGGLFAGATLTGVEVDGQSAEAAQRRLAEAGFPVAISVENFFHVEPPENDWDKYHAVIGNPPYIRYQNFAGPMRARAMEASLRAGVRLKNLSSAWAPFIVHASRFVRPDGRMALVLPAELLYVSYAAEIRRFLLERFAHIRLVMFEERVFPGVQEEVVLLLAEGTGAAPHFELYQTRNIATLQSDIAQWVPCAPDEVGKWSEALLPTADLEVYASVTASTDFVKLLDWGDTYLGSVTGANKYFSLTASEIALHGIPLSDLVEISPPGSRHLRGLTFTNSSWNELAIEEQRVYLLYPRDRPAVGTKKYIETGETAKVHLGYKCSNRRPWWRVPLVDPPDLLLTYMDRHRPRLVTNRANVRILNSLYGVRLRAGMKRLGKDHLPIAALNSVTLLGAEVVGRAYGGGMLKLEPTEADRLPMPSPELLERSADALRALQPHLSKDLRQGNLDAAVAQVDRVLLSEGVGLPHNQLVALRNARATLFGRRESRANH